MSHFSVAVITKTNTYEELEKQLAPFQENNMADCPSEFLTFYDTTDEYKHTYETGFREMVIIDNDKIVSIYDNMFIKENNNKNSKTIDDYRKINIPYKILYPTFDDYMKEFLSVEKDTKTNTYGYWENPNAKWDWWTINGRFSNILQPFTKIKNIDLTIDKTEYDKAIRFWEVIVEDSPLLDTENKNDFLNFYTKKYYIDRYRNKENYATYQSTFSCWAMITANGEWYEEGNMGWWGMNDATYDSINNYNNYFISYLKDNNNADYYLTIVDCHI